MDSPFLSTTARALEAEWREGTWAGYDYYQLLLTLVSAGHDVGDFGDVSYDNVPDLVGPENMDKYHHVVACMQQVSGLGKWGLTCCRCQQRLCMVFPTLSSEGAETFGNRR